MLTSIDEKQKTSQKVVLPTITSPKCTCDDEVYHHAMTLLFLICCH